MSYCVTVESNRSRAAVHGTHRQTKWNHLPLCRARSDVAIAQTRLWRAHQNHVLNRVGSCFYTLIIMLVLGSFRFRRSNFRRAFRAFLAFLVRLAAVGLVNCCLCRPTFKPTYSVSCYLWMSCTTLLARGYVHYWKRRIVNLEL